MQQTNPKFTHQQELGFTRMHLLSSIMLLLPGVKPGKTVKLTFGRELVACAFGTALHRNRSFTPISKRDAPYDGQNGCNLLPTFRRNRSLGSLPPPDQIPRDSWDCGVNPSPVLRLNVGPLQAVLVCSSPLETNHTFRWKQELVIRMRQTAGDSRYPS